MGTLERLQATTSRLVHGFAVDDVGEDDVSKVGLYTSSLESFTRHHTSQRAASWLGWSARAVWCWSARGRAVWGAFAKERAYVFGVLWEKTRESYV